jgi:hypothetical protein
MLYAADPESGRVVAIRGAKIAASIDAEKGFTQIRFAPGGRYAFLPNPGANIVQVIDTASNRIVQAADMTVRIRSRSPTRSRTSAAAAAHGDDPLRASARRTHRRRDFTGGRRLEQGVPSIADPSSRRRSAASRSGRRTARSTTTRKEWQRRWAASGRLARARAVLVSTAACASNRACTPRPPS